MEQEPEFIEAPKSAYLLYCDAKRPTIRRENPYLRNNELSKIIASHWKRATSHEKLPFVTEAKRLKSIQKKYFGEIQKPFNAYLIWIDEQRKELKNRDQEKAQRKTIVSELAAKWKTMSMDEKLPYLEQERIQKEEYQKAVNQIKTDLNLKFRAKTGGNPPRNAYMIFYKMKKEESGGKVNRGLVEEWRKIWKNMSHEEKKPFRDELDNVKGRFLKQSEWMEILNSEKQEKRIPVLDSIQFSKLETLNERRTLIFSTPPIHEKVNYDGLKWSKTENGKRQQPLYRTIVFDDSRLSLVQCTEASNPNLKKEVLLHLLDRVILRYFLTENGVFEIPDSSDVKKKRLGGTVSEDLKNNILPLRTTSAALVVANEKGYDLSRKQIRNMTRSIKSAIPEKSGRRVITTLADVKVLGNTNSNNLTYFVDQIGELVFTYLHVFEDALKIFAYGCPTKRDFEEWTERANRLYSESADIRKTELNMILEDFPSGVIFPSRIFVDTTFNLSDCYVTFVLGESGHFRTKTSNKPRVFPIGYMIHSHKDTSNHQMFAENIKTALGPFMTGRVAPAVLMDGEKSLQEYADALESSVIRCDWHILRLLSHKFGKKASKQGNHLIFGYKTVIQKPHPIAELIRKVNDFSEEKLNEIYKSAIGESDLVELSKDLSSCNASIREDHLRNIGLMCPQLLSYYPPRTLFQKLCLKTCNSEEESSHSISVISKTANHFVMENASAQKESDKVSLITSVQNSLLCSLCGKTLPKFICSHMMACLRSMDETDRKIELWRLYEIARNDSAVTVPRQSGKKQSARIGSRQSALNNIRKITNISDLTIFKDTEDGMELSDDSDEDTTFVVPTFSENHSNDDDSQESGAEQMYQFEDSNQNTVEKEFDRNNGNIFEQSPQSSDVSTFSPILTSTRLNASAQRIRRSTRRYSPGNYSSSLEMM
ncbi:hypothetical protein CRE_20975 [Caenorhabditis remanei]|uniref:HMG box domain-containing protein n=1 Tax=Caenorhabditis remanei TaxID=31234 RepID=E3NFR1_CAERE|nr:hypothetical protein CRE_20975 [Caenorhabditis remanei]